MNGMDMAGRWLTKAEDDLTVAKHTFDDLRPRQIEICCYHCQQSAEKALKAFLQYSNVEPPKTHNLVMLCQACCELEGQFDGIMECCSALTPYSITTRYPNDIEITEGEAREAILLTEEVLRFCTARMQ